MTVLTKKRIFEQKLRGEPINVAATNLPMMRKLLIECGVCENYGANYQISCKYPLNVWSSQGTEFKVDRLQPGDTYWWA